MNKTMSAENSAGAKTEIHCECGEAMNEACNWSGPKEKTVIIEWMPDQYRASHEAAGNHGWYPHNGSAHLRVYNGCANHLLAHDSEWTKLILDEA